MSSVAVVRNYQILRTEAFIGSYTSFCCDGTGIPLTFR
jgi:hypothetical protein